MLQTIDSIYLMQSNADQVAFLCDSQHSAQSNIYIFPDPVLADPTLDIQPPSLYRPNGDTRMGGMNEIEAACCRPAWILRVHIPGTGQRVLRLAECAVRRLKEQPGVVITHCGVTVAGYCLESLPVKDPDFSSVVADEFSSLQRAGSNGDATAAHPKYVGEMLMREMKMIGVCTIMRHQQPARQSWFGFMEMGTGAGLRQLRHQYVQVAVERMQQVDVVTQF